LFQVNLDGIEEWELLSEFLGLAESDCRITGNLLGGVGHNQQKIPLYAKLALNNHSFSFAINRSLIETT